MSVLYRIRPVKPPVVFCLRETRCDLTRRSQWGRALCVSSASRRVEWEQRVAAWKASGLTQKQYCAREGCWEVLILLGSYNITRCTNQSTHPPLRQDFLDYSAQLRYLVQRRIRPCMR